MKAGIFGGTFDPPHLGHFRSAEAAAEELGLDRLFVIPTGVPPHKDIAPGSPDGAQRMEMAGIASRGIACAEVLDIELKRSGKSYTVDTIDQLRACFPDCRFFLMIGTDMFLSFETWREFRKILENAGLAVFCRRNGDIDKIEEFASYMEKKYGAKADIIHTDAIDISSSELRKMLPERNGRQYLDDEVYAYIIKNGLYGAKPDFDWLREKSYSMLKPKRVAHVAGCEQEAVKLAHRWGADEDEAREAGILHDITKKLGLEEQLILCDKYGIITDVAEKKEEKLLHSKTGAAVARDMFNVSDDVYGAIFWHTTGKENMSLLEKVIYMADYIEPTRDFEGVDKLRYLAYKDLDAALILGLEMSIEDMRDRGIIPHNRTKQALDWLASDRERRKGK